MIFPCLLTALLLSSCSTHKSSPALSNREFAGIYAALTEKSVSVRSVRIDTALARHTADSILQARGVTESEVLATVNRLNDDPSQWKSVMEDALRDMRDSVGR